MSDPLQPIYDLILDGKTKGMPDGSGPVRLGDISFKGWSLLNEDPSFPVAVLRRSVIEQNSHWMADFLRRTGTSICPHGKTTMAPQLFHQQMADGAWGITLATAQQVRVAHAFGIKRILMANEIFEDGFIRWVQDIQNTDPAFEFICLVDSAAGVRRLDQAAPGKRQIRVLVEMGHPGGRTGVRTLEEGLTVARAVKSASNLMLAGVECFEGIIMSQDPEADESAITAWLDRLGDLACRCAAEDLFETNEVLLSAGGSAYFDLVVHRLSRLDLGRVSRVVLRSGCYLSHDAGHYARLVGRLEERLPKAWRTPGHLRPALEIWGRVISRPEPVLAILNFGKRDVGHDSGLPKPAAWFRPGHEPSPADDSWRISALYDQHAKMDIPADSELQAGDLVGCFISHPCTTFDKWPIVFMVDDGYRIVEAIKTFF